MNTLNVPSFQKDGCEMEISSIRILSTPVNGGPSTGRNVGLRAAKGKWVAILDSDDAWKPGRLKRLSEVAAETSADFGADNLVMWDAVRDAQFNKSYYTLSGRQKQVSTIDLFDADDNFSFTKESFSLMKPVYRRDFIVDKGLSYNETMKVGEDFRFMRGACLTERNSYLSTSLTTFIQCQADHLGDLHIAGQNTTSSLLLTFPPC
jgi:succinoglycan biosynthesis protein ExoO